MRCTNVAKIDKDKLRLVLRGLKMNQKEFAKFVGVEYKNFNQVASPGNMRTRYSQKKCDSILERLGGKYSFEDIFFWVD